MLHGNQRIMKSHCKSLFAALFLLAFSISSAIAQNTGRPAGWTAASHGNDVPANYELILPDDRINEIYITFTPESWQAEEEDMIEIYGERGAGDNRGREGGPGVRPGGRLAPPDIAEVASALDRSEEVIEAAIAFFPDFTAVAETLELEVEVIFEALGLPEGFAPPGNGGSANLQLASRNPIWVPVTIQFGDQTWWEVGFRYKGNSTLNSGWRSGTTALPFKLDFDEFEDENPHLDNQRFYGFKQLSFGASDFDPSLQREKVTADIFRAAGVPAAETAYYAVYVDNAVGDGFQYWGIYTAVELPDDTLIETQFSDDDGNMYKPSGPGATFAANSFTEEAFDKETNRNSSYDDILSLFAALHAETRLSDPASWRAQLETVFDVAGFLRWLATNTLLQNWDTYGVMSHNYYLYVDSETGQLVWIPWDNNMALQPSPRGPENDEQPAGRGLGGRSALSLSLEEVDAERWPLIGFLLEDAVYRNRYLELLTEVSTEVFTPQRMAAIYEKNYALLSAYIEVADGEDSLTALRQATDVLIDHVRERATAAADFLANSAN